MINDVNKKTTQKFINFSLIAFWTWYLLSDPLDR